MEIPVKFWESSGLRIQILDATDSGTRLDLSRWRAAVFGCSHFYFFVIVVRTNGVFLRETCSQLVEF